MTDLIPNDLSHMSDEDFNALCPQGEHAPGPEPLSPAAQAVRDAVLATYADNIPKDDNLWALERASTVAALRAAADRARRGPEHWEGSYPDDYDKGWNEAVDYFTTIAAELKNHHD